MRPALMETRCNDVIRVGEWNAAHSETFCGVSVVRLRHEVFYDAFDGLIIAACPGRPGAQMASKSPEQSDYRPQCREDDHEDCAPVPLVLRFSHIADSLVSHGRSWCGITPKTTRRGGLRLEASRSSKS